MSEAISLHFKRYHCTASDITALHEVSLHCKRYHCTALQMTQNDHDYDFSYVINQSSSVLTVTYNGPLRDQRSAATALSVKLRCTNKKTERVLRFHESKRGRPLASKQTVDCIRAAFEVQGSQRPGTANTLSNNKL